MQGRVFWRYSPKQRISRVSVELHQFCLNSLYFYICSHPLVSGLQVANLVFPMAALFCLSLRGLASRNPFWDYPETTSECCCAHLLADSSRLIQHPWTSRTTFGGTECTLLGPQKAHTKSHVEVFQDW